MSSLAPLTDESTLGQLLLDSAQVELSALSSLVAQQFERRPYLPGVVVVDAGAVVGMIARRRFHQSLSQPYGIEIFLKRPIQVFLDLHPQCRQPLKLSYTERIDIAVQQGLLRSFEDLFDPIVVTFDHPRVPQLCSFFLLDFHTLMLAQSQILAFVNTEMRQQKVLLEAQRKTAETYAHRLEQQQSLITERNQLLESQQQQLLSQSEAIQAFNQRFMEIGKVLSREGKKAFQATFAGVNAICHNTDQIVDVGRLLETELETIHVTSTLIEDLSRQVRHLSVQAAIVANQSENLKGFSYIGDEIAKLTNRTFEAGRQMNLLADRFQRRIKTFTTSAQSGTVVARSLIREIEQAAIALSDLENLVQHETDQKDSQPQYVRNIQQQEMAVLLKKLTLAESTLLDLRQQIGDKHTEGAVAVNGSY